jgi:hypothetical protein
MPVGERSRSRSDPVILIISYLTAILGVIISILKRRRGFPWA